MKTKTTAVTALTLFILSGCPGGCAGCFTTSSELSALTMTPESARIARGDSVQFVATATFTNGEVRDVTNEALWSVDDAFVGSASEETKGLIVALEEGSTLVRLRYKNKTVTRPLTVVTSVLRELQVDPPHPVIPIGLGIALKVTGLRSDGAKEDVTEEAIWTSASPDIANFEQGHVMGRAVGATTLTASVRGLNVVVAVDVTDAQVEVVDVQPPAFLLPVGLTRQLTATAVLSDGSSLDVTSLATWQSSAPTVAFASNLPAEMGLVAGRMPGSARVTATVFTKTGGTDVTVTSAQLVSLEMGPGIISLARGTSQPFTATGVFTDGTSLDLTSQVVWSSSRPATFTVNRGLVQAISVGHAELSATLGSVRTARDLQVTNAVLSRLDIQPSPILVARGLSFDATAQGTFSDGTHQDMTTSVIWRVDDTSLATVSNALATSGRVRANVQGVTELVATFGAVTARAPLTISGAGLVAVQIAPTTPVMPMGTTLPFTASGLFSDGTSQDITSQATWTSSQPTLVAVSSSGSSRGEVRAIAQGTATIRAAFGSHQGSTVVTVTDAALTRIEVSPPSNALPLGVTVRMQATGLFSDSTTADLTNQVTWSSSAPMVAGVSNTSGSRGEVKALSVGTAQVTAQFGSVTGTAQVDVTQAAMTGLEISPNATTMAVGLVRDFTAIASFSNGATQDVTLQATFTVSVPSIAGVATVGSVARVTGRSAGTTKLVAQVATFTAEADLTVSPAQLASLSINPSSISLAKGTTSQLHVQGTWTDGTTGDVTSLATWSSTDVAVMTVSNASGSKGALTAVSPGTVTLQAQMGTVVATIAGTVTPATLMAIELSPTTPTVPLGATQAFVATGRFTDGSAQTLTTQAAWNSSSPTVLSVSNASGFQGRATALAQGSSTLTATFGGYVGTTTVSVTAATLATVEISPPMPRVAKDTPLSLVATGIWTDGGQLNLTATCTWSSDTLSIATVSNAAGRRGRVFGVAAGTATITANCSGVSGSVTVTVTTATVTSIEVTPTSPTSPAGFTRALNAIGHFSDGSTQPFTDFVNWSSADVTIASVSNTLGEEGVVTARTAGTVLISANALSVTGSVSFVVSAALLQSVEVGPAIVSVPKGLGQNLVATGHFSDGTSNDVSESAVWTSSDPAIATVSNAMGTRGHVTAVTEGTVQISVLINGLTATSTLTVSPAALVSLALTPLTPSVAKGLVVQFTATGTFTDGTTRDLTEQVTWSAGDGAIATPSNANGTRGQALSLMTGNTSITASLGAISGSTTLTVTAALLMSIDVTPTNPSVPIGLSQQLTATGIYTDGANVPLTTQANWTTSDGLVATVSNAMGSIGQATAVATGSAVITASFGGQTGATTVNVTAAALQQLTITPPAPSVPAGLTVAVIGTGLYSDTSTVDLTSSLSWTSADPTIATASFGTVTGLRAGTTTLTGTVNGISDTVTITVTAALLQQIQVTPQNVSLPKGLTQQFTAMGVFSDATTSDLTSSVTWASDNGAIVSISNAMGSRGLASTPGIGGVTVSATLGLISGSTPFTVVAATLTSIALSPTSSTASVGSVRQYTATGTYTDSSTQNLTTVVTWNSSNQAVATISNATGSKGLTTILATGVTVISAGLNGLSASSNLVAIQNPLVQIDITPAAGSTALGYSRQFIAIGTYNDGTTQVLTTLATWASDDEAVAIVSNASGTQGLLSTVSTGNVNVTAIYQGITGTVAHAVTAEVLLALEITPTPIVLTGAATIQLTATGYFSDGSTRDLTALVTWASTNGAAAQVSNAGGSEGLVTAIAPGTTSISAASGAVSTAVNATVN